MSNRDVTNIAHQIQMTTTCHGMKPPNENFLRTLLLHNENFPAYCGTD